MRTLKKYLLLYFGLLFCCTPQENTNGEKKLAWGIIKLDSLMRTHQTDSSQIANTLLLLNNNFPYSETRKFKNDVWRSSINFKWNRDSSVIMITSKKSYDIGFKNETILHINDSALFIKRFLVGPAFDTTKLNFIDSYDYLMPKKTIKTLVRIKNLETLIDSIEFRALPFKDFSEKVEDHYEHELNYCQNILDRN